MKPPFRPLAASVLALALGLAAGSARGDMVVLVGNKQAIDGRAVAGEDIKITFPLAAGCVPKVKLTLLGAPRNRPISFLSSVVLGPDGKEIDVPGIHFRQSHVPGRDTVVFSGWAATAGGDHVLVLRTNAVIDADVVGKISVGRPTTYAFEGDENARSVFVPLQPLDESRVVVKRVDGTAPQVDRYVPPGETPRTPQQSRSAKGSTSVPFSANLFGDFEYRIGYQDPFAQTGRFKGKVKVRPFRGYGTEALLLVNDPGVALSVRTIDRYIKLPETRRGVGVSLESSGVVLVTSEQAGQILGQRYTSDLDPILVPASEYSPVVLADSFDLVQGETISGHRVVAADGAHFLGFSTASGASLLVKRINHNRTTAATARIVENSTTPTHDFFLATDGSVICVGRFLPPDGHVVHFVDAATTLPSETTVSIGGPTRAHVNGAGAGWNPESSVWELWAPSTLDPQGSSDLHHLVFDGNWAPVSADQTPVADPAVHETFPTAVAVDPDTGFTIVHWVVPEFPYDEGRIHRAVFDAAGVEVPGSRTVLAGARRHRPTTLLAGNFLYLASDGPDGPTVERWRVLR